MQQQVVNRSVLIAVLVLISIFFFRVVQPFIQAIFIAALFAALFHPLYRRLKHLLGERESLASLATLLIVLFFVVTPLSVIFSIVVSQAAELADRVVPMVQEVVSTPGAASGLLSSLPFYETLQPYRSMLLDVVGNFSSGLSGWAVQLAQTLTRGTIGTLVSLLIVLYTMYFLLIDGDKFLYYLLYYIPLNDDDETELLARFLSVTRATLKGTAVIGILQGGLAGSALALAGIPSALFLSVTMMFLSVVPGVGSAIVWLPATLFLFFSGDMAAAFLVGGFCAIVVGGIDNLLRPKLVGNDTQLHELMIFFSTLGGLLMFGFMGFIIGPIIAALFVTVWELYGHEFSSWLPTTAFRPYSGEVALPHERNTRGRRRAGARDGVDSDNTIRRSPPTADDSPPSD
jgi:predicted PurR-regulated permease PerM